jgi:hypothetical protein
MDPHEAAHALLEGDKSRSKIVLEGLELPD